MMGDIIDIDEFVKKLGDTATPYLEYLKDLDETEISGWVLRDKFLFTKFGEVHTSIWDLMKQDISEGETTKTVKVKGVEESRHPVESLIMHRDQWRSLVAQDKPSLENLKYEFWIVQRLWRPQTLFQLMVDGKLKHLSDPEYWELVMQVWRDTEVPMDEQEIWEAIFSAREPDASTTEFLPSEVTIYRAGHKSGLSWSLSYETAKWFVRRSKGKGLWKTTVRKEDILFFTDEREEQEVVLKEPRKWHEVIEIPYVRDKDSGEVIELEEVA